MILVIIGFLGTILAAVFGWFRFWSGITEAERDQKAAERAREIALYEERMRRLAEVQEAAKREAARIEQEEKENAKRIEKIHRRSHVHDREPGLSADSVRRLNEIR